MIQVNQLYESYVNQLCQTAMSISYAIQLCQTAM